MTELGNLLKEARKEKQISLEDLQDLTKIQKRYLLGIEEGNYEMMPGKFYVRAFIRQYAEAVGLDPEMIFDQYKDDIPKTYNNDLPEQLSRVRTRKNISSKGSRFVELLPKIVLAIFILGVAVALWIFFQKQGITPTPADENIGSGTEVEESDITNNENSGEDKEEAKENIPDNESSQTDESQESKSVQDLTIVESSGNTATLELKNKETFILDIISKGEPWISVENGKGRSFFADTMKNGDTQTFDLTKETDIRLNIGRTFETELKINGKIVEYPFDPNEKVQQKLTILYNQ